VRQASRNGPVSGRLSDESSGTGRRRLLSHSDHVYISISRLSERKQIMQKARFGIAVSLLVVLAGCTQGTPGGPGVQSTPAPSTGQSTNQSATQTTNKPVISNSKETFSLKTPALSTSLKQGETKSADISIARGTDFKDDVSLRFSGVPEGITLDPMSPMLKASEKDVKINVTAADSAALGDFRIKVIGHPSGSGPDAESDFKLTVSAK